MCGSRLPVQSHIGSGLATSGLVGAGVGVGVSVRVSKVKRLIQLKTVKGFYHIFGLPVNGQRNKTNANTRRKARKFALGEIKSIGNAKKFSKYIKKNSLNKNKSQRAFARVYRNKKK